MKRLFIQPSVFAAEELCKKYLIATCTVNGNLRAEHDSSCNRWRNVRCLCLVQPFTVSGMGAICGDCKKKGKKKGSMGAKSVSCLIVRTGADK